MLRTEAGGAARARLVQAMDNAGAGDASRAPVLERAG